MQYITRHLFLKFKEIIINLWYYNIIITHSVFDLHKTKSEFNLKMVAE